MSRSRRRRIVGIGASCSLVVALAVVVVILQTTRWSTDGPSPSGADPAAAASSSPTLTGTPAQVVAQVMAELSGTDVTALAAGQPPGNLESGVWLYADVNVPSTADGQFVHAAWLADLAESAVTTGLQPAGITVPGLSITGHLPDGTTEALPAGPVGSPDGSGPAPSTLPDSDVLAHAGQVVQSFGLTLDSATVIRLSGPALALTVDVPDMRLVQGKVAQLESEINSEPYGLVGWFLQLRGPDGSVFLRSSDVRSEGVGRLWISPTVTTDLGVDHA